MIFNRMKSVALIYLENKQNMNFVYLIKCGLLTVGTLGRMLCQAGIVCKNI